MQSGTNIHRIFIYKNGKEQFQHLRNQTEFETTIFSDEEKEKPVHFFNIFNKTKNTSEKLQAAQELPKLFFLDGSALRGSKFFGFTAEGFAAYFAKSFEREQVTPKTPGRKATQLTIDSVVNKKKALGPFNFSKDDKQKVVDVYLISPKAGLSGNDRELDAINDSYAQALADALDKLGFNNRHFKVHAFLHQEQNEAASMQMIVDKDCEIGLFIQFSADLNKSQNQIIEKAPFLDFLDRAENIFMPGEKNKDRNARINKDSGYQERKNKKYAIETMRIFLENHDKEIEKNRKDILLKFIQAVQKSTTEKLKDICILWKNTYRGTYSIKLDVNHVIDETEKEDLAIELLDNLAVLSLTDENSAKSTESNPDMLNVKPEEKRDNNTLIENFVKEIKKITTIIERNIFLKNKINTLLEELDCAGILILFKKIKDRNNEDFSWLHKQKNPNFDYFRLFFKLNANGKDEARFWHTERYQCLVKKLKDAYLEKVKKAHSDSKEHITKDREKEEQYFLQYQRHNFFIPRRETKTKKAFDQMQSQMKALK